MPYNPIPVEQDPHNVAALLIAEVAASTGATLREGHPVTVMLEAVGMAVADMNRRMAHQADTFFDDFGEQIIGIKRKQAGFATLTITPTAITPVGVTPIPTGTVFTVDGHRFELVEGGESSQPWTLLALVEGHQANGLTPTSIRAVEHPWTVTCTPSGPSEGGVVAETKTAYRDRLAEALSNLATTAVTPEDCRRIAIGVTGVAKATVRNRWDPDRPGEDTLGHVTLALVGPDGRAVSESVKQEVQDRVETVRAINLSVHLVDPTVVPLQVHCWVHRSDSSDEPSVRQAVTEGLKRILGILSGGTGGQHTVYAHEVARHLGDIPGVDRIHDLRFNGTHQRVTIGDPATLAVTLDTTVEVVFE